MELDAQKALLQKFAPIVYLHSKEKYFPCTIEIFLTEWTKLVFRDRRRIPTSPGTYQVSDIDIEIQAPAQSPSDEPSDKAYNVNDAVYRPDAPASEYRGKTYYSSYAKSRNERAPFRTTLTSNTYREGAGKSGYNKVPFYAAVMETYTHRDLLYAFFYAWDDSAPNNPTDKGEHQGDWEHIVIRIDPSDNILGVFIQAHTWDNEFTRWYYPEKSQGVGSSSTYKERNFSLDPETKRVVIYSAQYSHGSYPTAGEQHRIFMPSVWPSDWTNAGYRWAPYEDGEDKLGSDGIVVMDGTEPWNDYNGNFGTSPYSPLVQGWMKINAPLGGPNVPISVEITRDQVTFGERYSGNFRVCYPKNVRWTFEIEAVPPLSDDQLQGISIEIAGDDTGGTDDTFYKNVTNGSIKNGYQKPPLYVDRLKYGGKSGDDVFKTLNIRKFILVGTPTDELATRNSIEDAEELIHEKGYGGHLTGGPIIQFGSTKVVDQYGNPSTTDDHHGAGDGGFHISFDPPFTKIPVVVLTPYFHQAVDSPETIVSVTTTGFSVSSKNNRRVSEPDPYYINWIAISHE